MFEIFTDTMKDTLAMVPLLFMIYAAIEFVEYRFGNSLRKKVQKAGATGPAIGAFVGSLPQCGFSVIASALYTQRLATIGTLLAVYLSTSDEAIPIILSQPDKISIVWPLIFTKIFIALIAGYSIDFIFKKNNKKTLQHISAYAHGKDDKHHHHELILEEEACCGHSTNSLAKKFSPKEIFLHPLFHTGKIFLFIFLVSFLLNFAISSIGEDALKKIFLQHSFFQPFLAAIFGLIPNCAASVAITQLYLDNIITYGSMIAGLCASGGLGILILFKETKEKKEALKVIAILFTISVAAGIIIQSFFNLSL